MDPESAGRQPAGAITRVATIAWSVGIAIVVILLSAAVLLPSTKRARIEFVPDGPATQSAPEPTTQPSTSPSAVHRRVYMPSSKSAAHSLDGQNLMFGDGHVEFQEGAKDAFGGRVLPGTKIYIVGKDLAGAATRATDLLEDNASDLLWLEDNASHRLGSSKFSDIGRNLAYSYSNPYGTTVPTTSPSTRPSKIEHLQVQEIGAEVFTNPTTQPSDRDAP